MIYFMYTFDYDGSGINKERASPMIFNVEVYSIADKYGVLALKSRAKEKFDRIVKTCWDIDDFAHAITEVYSSTPSTDRGLRDTVIEVARNNISTLLEKKDFRSVLEETVGFAADVTQLMNRNQKRSFVKFVCPSCGEDWEAFPKRSMTYCPCCGHYRSDWDNYAVQ
jgi:speckle-type POZ protein